MPRQHSDRTPARSQRASTDVPTPKKRKRCRMFGLVRQNKSLAAVDARVLERTLRDLPLKAWVFGRHGASTGCVDCAGTEDHFQCAIRFTEVRDLHVVEALFPGFKVIPLVGATAWRDYVKYLPHGTEHEVVASFDFEEFLAKYGGTPVKSLLYRDIKRMVYEGEMTLLAVHRDHREVYINHWRALEALAAKGEEMRKAEREATAARERAERAAASRREADRVRRWERTLEGQAHVRDVAETFAQVEAEEMHAHLMELKIEKHIEEQEHAALHEKGLHCNQFGCTRGWDMQIRRAAENGTLR